jgi:hypothetical protein
MRNIAARRSLLEQAIDDMAVRALGHRRKIATTAIRMLVAARLLLQPLCRETSRHLRGASDEHQPEVWTLPVELVEAIVVRLDTEGVLAGEERKRVVAFALRDMAGTRDKSRAQFLRECVVSLTWWPEDSACFKPAKKRKRSTTSDSSHGFCITT